MTTHSTESSLMLSNATHTDNHVYRISPPQALDVIQENQSNLVESGYTTKGVISSIGGLRWDSDGHPIWKTCSHRRSLSGYGDGITAECASTDTNGNYRIVTSFSSSANNAQIVRNGLGDQFDSYMQWLNTAVVPTDFNSLTQEAIDGFWSSLNLNFEDSVQLYSDVFQMIPLVGTVLKINTVLNKVGSWATKELRRKPFRTVLKAAISADFIKRFVVDTTMRDINMVLNVENDLLTRLNTLNTRNMSDVLNYKVSKSYSNILDTYKSSRKVLSNRLIVGESASHLITRRYTSQVTLNVLAAVRYQEDPNLPAKLIAQRLGLTRPLESAWDLVPFSFVADYFLRTGDFIHELSKEMDSSDSAIAKVGSIRGIWLQTKGSCQIQDNWSTVFSSTPPWGHPSPRSGIDGIGSSVYNRYPLSNLWSSGGFFDGSGMWNPKLSSTRKRTIVELFIQRKL